MQHFSVVPNIFLEFKRYWAKDTGVDNFTDEFRTCCIN